MPMFASLDDKTRAKAHHSPEQMEQPVSDSKDLIQRNIPRQRSQRDVATFYEATPLVLN